MHTPRQVFRKDKIEIIDCVECGYKHLRDIPDQKFIESFYEKQYFVSTQSDYYENQLKDNEYLSACFRGKYNDIIRFLKDNQEKSILDIGCGSGLYLKFFHDAGWQCTGIEPSLSGISNYSKQHGIHIYENTFEAVYSTVGKFSVVALNNVLEHVIEPRKMCELIYRHVLADDGIIQVTVPNDFNPMQIAAYTNKVVEPYWIAYPDHINYFNTTSIVELLTGAGFVFLDATVSFPLEFFILMGKNYVGNPTEGKEIHYLRTSFELSLEAAGMESFKKELYRKFYELGIGREVTILCRKEAG